MSKPIKRILLRCIFFVLLSSGAAQSGFAQDVTPPGRQNDGASEFSRNIQPANNPAELLAKAQTLGQVRVIVGLNTSARFQPEGGLTTAQAQSQRSGIAQVQQSLMQSLTPYGATVLAQSNQWTIPYLALQINAAGLQALQTSAAVTSIQEDHMNFLSNNSASLTNMGVPPAWANGYDGAGYTVAILDVGVQATHNYLGGRVVDEFCSSTNDNYYMPYAQFKSVCPNGSTSVWGSGAADPATCASTAATSGLPSEKCDHGTHVAGIAAGNDGNDNTVNDGVARAANIIGVQVFTYLDCKGSNIYCSSASNDAITAFDSNIIAGLNHVYFIRNDFHIASVNMSLGGGFYNNQAECNSDNAATKAAIDQLRSVNIATIIASGNEYYGNGLAAPACISSAIAVGSTSDFGEAPDYLTGKISSFTNTHAMLDLLAPGYDIYSSITVPTNTGMGYKSGTSMASPQVTGAWAVVREPLPNASVAQILGAFQATGTPVRDDLRATGYRCFYTGNNPCTGLTFKLINVNAAIDYLRPSIPILANPSSTGMTSSKPKLTWTAQRANQYKIFLDTVNPPLTELATVNTASYTPTTPLEAKVYYWQVRAYNDLGGVSDLSDVGVFVVDVPPNLNFTTDTTPTLTWIRLSWATGYEVQVADNAAFTGATTYPVAVPELSLTLPSDLGSGTYYWRVRAYNGATAGTWTPAQPITILAS